MLLIDVTSERDQSCPPLFNRLSQLRGSFRYEAKMDVKESKSAVNVVRVHQHLGSPVVGTDKVHFYSCHHRRVLPENKINICKAESEKQNILRNLTIIQ